MIWVLTEALVDSIPFSDEQEKNLMNFRAKSKELYHHSISQDLTSKGGANERNTCYRTGDGGNFRQPVGNVLCSPHLPEHQENHGQGGQLKRTWFIAFGSKDRSKKAACSSGP